MLWDIIVIKCLNIRVNVGLTVSLVSTLTETYFSQINIELNFAEHFIEFC